MAQYSQDTPGAGPAARAAGAAVAEADGIGPPAEIAFLAQQGFPPYVLLAAIEGGCDGAAATLLGEGLVNEEDYYRALARHLGVIYYTGEKEFAPGLEPTYALICGVAPLQATVSGPRAVIAPRGAVIGRLIERVERGELTADTFAVTSPTRLAALMRARHGDAIVRRALSGLPCELSAKGGMTFAQSAALIVVLALLSAATIRDPSFARWLWSPTVWAIYAAAVLLRLIAVSAAPPGIVARWLTEQALPTYTIVAPLYRETEVVADLIHALDALDYPRAKLDIKLVVERDDRETLSRIAAMRLPGRYDVVVAPPGGPTTKPRALDIALLTARGSLLVIFDAEDAPAPEQLRLAASRFAAEPELDCLQARLTIRNPGSSWLSHLFAIEYAVLFDLVNPGLCALGLPIALGGTSNHFRVSALRAIGAWDAWNVTEDADLGVRMARRRMRIRALDSDTSEEAPYEFANWFHQRVRWQKGWIQTCIVHSRRPVRLVRELGAIRAAAATALVAGTVMTSLFGPFLAIETLWRAVFDSSNLTLAREVADVFTYILALLGAQAIILPAVVASRRRAIETSFWTYASMPAYFALVSAAAWVAAFDLAIRPFHWAKTAHGRVQAETPAATNARPEIASLAD